MEFDDDPLQLAWRREVRDFIKANVTDALLTERHSIGYDAGGPEFMTFRKKVGERGWFGVGWPEEHGGLGLGPIEQQIMFAEFEYAGAPSRDLTVESIAPMIMRHGTAQNKAEFLPAIARGELIVAVGYSEPEAGSDLASLKTRAVLDGDTWVINGHKIWNSYAHFATHEWLCVRTDPEAPKHRGISVIIVPIATPGVDVHPLQTWCDYRTNETFFADVRVPAGNLIGQVNQGWQYITGALDLERATISNAGRYRRAVDDLLDLARQPLPTGRVPADDPLARRKLAQLDADVEVAELLALQGASMLESGDIPTVTVAAQKIYAAELCQRIADVALQIFGIDGLQARGSFDPVADGAYEHLYRYAPVLRFGGGSNEILRDVIAQRGHGLPRYGR